MQVKGALKKARKVAMGSPSTARYLAYIALLLKLVAMGLLCTARYSAYIALPTNLANEEVARGLPDTARCQAYHCTTSSACARRETVYSSSFVKKLALSASNAQTALKSCLGKRGLVSATLNRGSQYLFAKIL